MANKSISMSKVRQIIKLYAQHMGKKKIGERLGMSKHTVKLYTDQFQALKILKEDLLKLSDFELNELFHPPKETLINNQLKQLYDFFPAMISGISKQLVAPGVGHAQAVALNSVH